MKAGRLGDILVAICLIAQIAGALIVIALIAYVLTAAVTTIAATIIENENTIEKKRKKEFDERAFEEVDE